MMHVSGAFGVWTLAVFAFEAYAFCDAGEGTCPSAGIASVNMGSSLIQAESTRDRSGREKIGKDVTLNRDLSEHASREVDKTSGAAKSQSNHRNLAQAEPVQATFVALNSTVGQHHRGAVLGLGEIGYTMLTRVNVWLAQYFEKGGAHWLIIVCLVLLIGICAVVAASQRSGSRSALPSGDIRSPLQSFPDRKSTRFPERRMASSPAGSPGTGATLRRDAFEPPKLIAGTPPESQFCPELVVPGHCECSLLLPLNMPKVVSPFEVTDLTGGPILRVVPQPPAHGRLWGANITSATGELLAQCCDARHHASSIATGDFYIKRANGQYYAKVMQSTSPDRYMINLMNGVTLHVRGNFDNQAMDITDDSDRMYATTEIGPSDFDPQGRYLHLRVAPLADVGLAICGLLCVGQHAQSQKNQEGVLTTV
jgi:hypothetical protein